MDDHAPPSSHSPPPSSTPPPVLPRPPVIVAPAASAPSRRGRGWMILALILLGLLLMSMLFNLANFAGHLLRGPSGSYYSHSGGPRLQEFVVEDHSASEKFALLKVRGIITGESIEQGGFSMVDVFRSQLKLAEEDDHVKAVILKVDSPGGEVLASDEIARAITKFQDKSGKPVVVSMGDLAASGGYYVSSPCRWIVANDVTLTGSIGVILSTWNYRGLMDKVGVRPFTFKSGKFKDMLSGSREPDTISEEETNMVQGLIEHVYGSFTNVVQKGRDWAHSKNKDQGQALSATWAKYADGRVLSGKEAFDLGLVDELGGFETALEQAKKLSHIQSANLIEYQQRYTIGDLLHLAGQNDSKNVKLDLGLDLPKLKAGQPYYLSPLLMQ